MSNLSAFPYIPERAEATPALWNNIFSVLSANDAALNSAATISFPSGNTLSVFSSIDASGNLHAGNRIGIGVVPSADTVEVLTIGADSSKSDYILFHDPTGAKSSYVIGSRVGGTADGLNIYDASGSTMIASFSKQSVRFFQQVVGPVFDVGGALASTLNAATFGTGADSKESRIQAAILAAAAQSIARVYVPANMYPYSASSVSFIHTVQMTREGGNDTVQDILAYGADSSGVLDATAAIDAADLNSSAVPFRAPPVYFPPGTYRCNSTLTYRGVPWFGAGTNDNTRLDLRSTITGIDAVGTSLARRIVDIRDMLLLGTNSGNSAYGIALGWNQRSTRGLENLFIYNFGRSGIVFAQPNWVVKFGDIRLTQCGNRVTGGMAGIGVLPTATNLLALDFHDLIIESCGTVGSGIGGSIHLPSGVQAYEWNFHGGTIEDNFGIAEAKFINGIGISFHGTYFEGTSSSVASDSLVFDGTNFYLGGTIHTGTVQTGKAVRAINACVGAINGSSIDPAFQGGVISVENTSRVVASGVSMNGGTIVVGGSASFSNIGGPSGTSFGSNVSIIGNLDVSGALTMGTVGSNIISTADGQVFRRTGISTNFQYLQLGNTSGSAYLGLESSVAGNAFTGSEAYATILYSTLQPVQIITGGSAPSRTRFGSEYVVFGGHQLLPVGSATTPTLGFSSETSLGWYRSGANTIAQSLGTLNLATNAVRLSMRTLAGSAVTASAANTNIATNEVVFTVTLASGASLLISSGGTTWGFNSTFSVKNT